MGLSFLAPALYTETAAVAGRLFRRLRRRAGLRYFDMPLIPETPTKNILHICSRETLRPLRDQILRLSGFDVDSTLSTAEGLSMFWSKQYDLVLIDVEGEQKIKAAEAMCSEIKTGQPEQVVAFVCNWRVAVMTDCPDEILRTEFDPQRFVSGVRTILSHAEK